MNKLEFQSLLTQIFDYKPDFFITIGFYNGYNQEHTNHLSLDMNHVIAQKIVRKLPHDIKRLKFGRKARVNPQLKILAVVEKYDKWGRVRVPTHIHASITGIKDIEYIKNIMKYLCETKYKKFFGYNMYFDIRTVDRSPNKIIKYTLKNIDLFTDLADLSYYDEEKYYQKQ